MAPQSFPRTALEQSIPACFAERAARHPDRPAVRGDTHALTYADLDRASEGLAGAIVARQRRDGRPVALLMAHDAPIVSAILGVLKSGAPYVALDPRQPMTRLRAVIDDAGPALIVCDGGRREAALALAAGAREVLDA